MTEGSRSLKAEADKDSQKEEKKKQAQVNGLILAGVFLLGVLLPDRYKAFAPFLFVIPVVMKVVNKWSKDSTEQFDSTQATTYSKVVQGTNRYADPYSFQPKDPKDPRKYKPIG